MSLKMLMAALILSAGATVAVPVAAADLTGPEVYGDRSPYADPRYGDIYRHPAPPPRRYAAPYAPYDPPGRMLPRDRGYPPAYQQRPTDRDERGYLRPFAPGPRDRPPGYRREDRFAGECVPRAAIRARLLRQGWHDFRDVSLQGGVAVVRARSAGGRWFELNVDRCMGRIVSAQRIYRRTAASDDRYGAPPYR